MPIYTRSVIAPSKPLFPGQCLSDVQSMHGRVAKGKSSGEHQPSALSKTQHNDRRERRGGVEALP